MYDIENKDNNENIKNSNQKYIEKYGDLNFEIICKNINGRDILNLGDLGVDIQKNIDDEFFKNYSPWLD